MNYLDLIILVVLVIIVIICFRSFKSCVYLLGITDLFLRIINFIATHINIPKVSHFLKTKFPVSIIGIINKYTKGILNDILVWIFVGLMVCFLVYLMIYFFKKKK